MAMFRTFSALSNCFPRYQGRRVPLRFTLAPGYYISRLRRCRYLGIYMHAFNPQFRLSARDYIRDLSCNS
jgi:hypothetical protein